jgi:hypothetical protein
VSWLRLDDRFAHHPKVATLSDKAFRAHVQTMLYVAEYGTDGVIPPTSFRITGATPKVREALVEAGLWDENSEKSELFVHDWRVYNGETIEIKVAAVLSGTPDLSANEICRLVGGKRQLVLAEIQRQRETGGSEGGSVEPSENQPPGGSDAVPENQADRFPSGSLSRARARGPVPSLDPVDQDPIHETEQAGKPELHDVAAAGLPADSQADDEDPEPQVGAADFGQVSGSVRSELLRLRSTTGGATP